MTATRILIIGGCVGLLGLLSSRFPDVMFTDDRELAQLEHRFGTLIAPMEDVRCILPKMNAELFLEYVPVVESARQWGTVTRPEWQASRAEESSQSHVRGTCLTIEESEFIILGI